MVNQKQIYLNNKNKVGIGFDVHAIKKQSNGFINLCGVKVNCEYKFIAHSDGDVALHALTDALLGCSGNGDIGMHFPPTDNKWKNVSSEIFVKFARDFIIKAGGSINNVDITIICESPKISLYREKFKNSIAEILSISASAVNIKATTTEGLGFTGRKEGIACQAIASVQM